MVAVSVKELVEQLEELMFLFSHQPLLALIQSLHLQQQNLPEKEISTS